MHGLFKNGAAYVERFVPHRNTKTQLVASMFLGAIVSKSKGFANFEDQALCLVHGRIAHDIHHRIVQRQTHVCGRSPVLFLKQEREHTFSTNSGLCYEDCAQEQNNGAQDSGLCSFLR